MDIDNRSIRMMAAQPESSSRTLTFLFTDLEGSTQLWEQHPQAMKAALSRHDAILRTAVEQSNGQVVKTTGDGMMAVFASALDGVRGCVTAQHSLQDEPWGEPGPLHVRMGLHVGEAQPRSGDYYGPAVNRAARLMGVAHGGQVLLSGVAASLVADLLPEGVTLKRLGQHRLKDLAQPEQVYQLIAPGLPVDFPPLASLDRHPNNLPAQPTALIGREDELREVMNRLTSDSVRLVTLTGPGGIGKTRLALQAAAELIDRFPDGVFFVDLAPIRTPEGVLSVISQTLGLRENSDRPPLDELIGQLKSKQILLLLDNFEQVIPAAPKIASLLQGCPQLELLVTSREALHVRGEHIFPVPPLALPVIDTKHPLAEQLSQYEAVRLFIERAQAVKPDFQVTNENAPAVAEICVRLDGLPLAIELAAARIRIFSPQALLDRLGTRLKLLQGGARDLPVRQQTLRDAIHWSYELLDGGEQLLFQLLSVFSGGGSFEAVEAIGGVESEIDILDGLTSLVDKSLVRQVEQESGEPRVLMLETIREYAAERLAEDPEYRSVVRRAHAAYFADFTQRQWERLTGDEREAALAELAGEIENVRAAWDYWVAEKDLERLNQFVDSLWLLNDARGWYHATVRLTNDLLEVLSETPATPERLQEQILLHTSLARALLAIKGYTPEVEAAFRRALELAETAQEIPQLYPVLRGLSSLYTNLGDFEKGAQMGEKILRLAERQNDASMRIDGDLVYGYSLVFTNHLDQGLEHLEKAIRDFSPERYRSNRFRLGNHPGVASLTVSAMLSWITGFPERAIQRAGQGVQLAKMLNHPYSIAYALHHNSFLHFWQNELEQAYDGAQEVIDVSREYEFLMWEAVATSVQGAAMAGMGEMEAGLEQVVRGNQLYLGLKTPPIFWSLLAYLQTWVYLQMGRPEQGLALLSEMLANFPNHEHENMLMPEFSNMVGKLLLAIDPQNAGEAETMFQQALDTARRRRATMLELRAAISLCRLWQGQDKAEQGRQLLSVVYEKFTEGFEMADLREAYDLLGRAENKPSTNF